MKGLQDYEVPLRLVFAALLLGIVSFFCVLLSMVGNSWLSFSFADGGHLTAGLVKGCTNGNTAQGIPAGCSSLSSLSGYENFSCMSRLNHYGMLSIVLYVTAAAFGGAGVLASGAIGGCYANSRYLAIAAFVFACASTAFSVLGWINYATAVAGNHRCESGKKGAFYIIAIIGAFIQFFAALLSGAHWANLSRLMKEALPSYRPTAPKQSSSYTNLPADTKPIMAAGSSAARTSYGTASAGAAAAPGTLAAASGPAYATGLNAKSNSPFQ
eukprot:c13379_g1_i2.p1 GENE.c13379_g1_i2~~c13379_g1_i2.p1  ORF type:complete len:282 (+),score=55.25 c13379_g1_i2:37-846(+)